MRSKIPTNRRPLARQEAARVVAAPFPKRTTAQMRAIARHRAGDRATLAVATVNSCKHQGRAWSMTQWFRTCQECGFVSTRFKDPRGRPSNA